MSFRLAILKQLYIAACRDDIRRPSDDMNWILGGAYSLPKSGGGDANCLLDNYIIYNQAAKTQ